MIISNIKDIPLNKKVRISGTIGRRTTMRATGIFKKEDGKVKFYNDENISYFLEDEMKEIDILHLGVELWN